MLSMRLNEKGETIEDWMNIKPVVTTPDKSVSDAAKIMTSNKIGALIVNKQGDALFGLIKKDPKMIGILTDTDIVRKVVAQGIKAYNTRISSVMTSNIITIDRTRSLIEASEIMTSKKIKRLPVVEDGKPVGIITTTDIMYASSQLNQTQTTKDILSSRDMREKGQILDHEQTVAGAWMTTSIAKVTEDKNVMDAAVIMNQWKIGALLVTRGDNNLSGIITDTDIVRKVVALDLDPKTTPIARVMTKDVITINSDTDLSDLTTLVTHKHFKRTPVVDDGKLVGIISTTDIMKALFKLSKLSNVNSIISMLSSKTSTDDND